MKVYGKVPGEGGRDGSYEYPDYQQVLKLMKERKNMTLQVCWDRYAKTSYRSLHQKMINMEEVCRIYAM